MLVMSDNKRGKKTQSFLELPDRRHKMTGENLRKEVLPEAANLQEGDNKRRAKITLKETVRLRRVIIGILSYVKITNLNRDANSAKNAYSDTLRLTVSKQKA